MSTYLQNSEGTFIPATKRPDGTWRKARRVKDGYVPQEEVPLYESKGKQFAQRQTRSGVPPGMCPLVAAEAKKEREKQERAKTKKLEKELTKSSKTIVSSAANVELPTCPTTTAKPKQMSTSKSVIEVARTLEDTLKLDDVEKIDTAKQIKKLRKKIREIELIESRMKAGEVKKLDKDQLDKIKKKPEILEQIKLLEDNSVLPQS
ncbi:partner of Y14 and mago [Scaptodrosophila lebanonensis]|uniref:Partner of Y14 and mago n=1 Tax=Drosophila lebanonensis TaxID=7225 RepID=A0A6J2TYB3_DROLE|nr:partner of Y14 and mago [Scaptodrosophila lebanonensis]